ncbi:MAG: aspartate/tyrosine/aromatic aminotransferase [Gammaproteobacteria bacterium]|nr:aspartate/tyrosine/aromatic aminotransferase [Gammaproteobacteria bacterium]
MLFESMQTLPADAILGLIAEYKNDSRADKIDLGVGVYRNADGLTPVLDVVKTAEQRLVDTQDSKAYLGTAGSQSFNAAMQTLTFAGSADDARVTTLQAPGGSGSLRVAAGLLLRARKKPTVWVSEPTWNNHVPLLGGAGLELKPYPYYDTDRHVIDADAMLEALRSVPKGDIVLLHACCHNPSGLDPTEQQWRAISDVIIERELVPFIDMAYQGFSADLDTDAFVVRHLADKVAEMIVTNSCSKNFGLYRDRVGSLSIMAADSKARAVVASQASNVVRTIYSVPPDHGAAIVEMILNDASLTSKWQVELAQMRDRLREVRVLLHDALKNKASSRDFSHLTRATGMFCFLGINAEQIDTLKADYGIYMIGSSRINVAGVTTDNVEYLAESITAVL